MRIVEHDDERYLLVKRSGESSLVRDPETGEERYLPNDELTLTGDSPLAVAAGSVPAEVRQLVTAVHSAEGLGLLVELDDRGPLAVREVLDSYDQCESDLHGLVGELRAAGILEERDVDGRRGYGLTESARRGLAELRS